MEAIKDLNYNAIVYEYDLEHNQRIYKAIFSEDKRVLKFCGKTLIIETPESFIETAEGRAAEGNTLTGIEKQILKELMNKE